MHFYTSGERTLYGLGYGQFAIDRYTRFLCPELPTDTYYSSMGSGQRKWKVNSGVLYVSTTPERHLNPFPDHKF